MRALNHRHNVSHYLRTFRPALEQFFDKSHSWDEFQSPAGPAIQIARSKPGPKLLTEHRELKFASLHTVCSSIQRNASSNSVARVSTREGNPTNQASGKTRKPKPGPSVGRTQAAAPPRKKMVVCSSPISTPIPQSPQPIRASRLQEITPCRYRSPGNCAPYRTSQTKACVTESPIHGANFR